MKIEQQLNIKDRTLLLGVPKYDGIPKTILVDGRKFDVVGISHGVKPPYISVEIVKTTLDLKEKEARDAE